MPALDISGNVIFAGASGPFANQSGSFSGASGPFANPSAVYVGGSGPYGSFGVSSAIGYVLPGSSGASGPSGPSNATGNTPIISYRNITDSDRTICNITHEQILEHDSYMQCNICHLNYSENALKTWLERRRTCPTCREPWTNNRVYINLMLD